MEFKGGDQIVLKVSLMRKVMRFGKSGRPNPRCVRLFEVIKRIGEITYLLALLPALARLHDVFLDMSMLKKYLHDPSHILSYEFLDVDPKWIYEERLIKISNKRNKVLHEKKNIIVSLYKVLWRN